MPGYSLLELLLVLTLLAVGASTLVPTARRTADVVAVTATREELIGVVQAARAAALSAGGSRLVIDAASPGARIDVDYGPPRRWTLGQGRGVRVDLGGRDSTALRFDGLGIGRFSSQTVVLRRGAATASLVVSSYGRVSRR